MARKIVEPRVRRLICTNAHPAGCTLNLRRLAEKAGAAGAGEGLGNVLVLGSSTGYGLASLATAVWGWGADALSVCFERPPEGERTGSAGWYNISEVHRIAREEGRQVETLNGDAYSHEIRQQAIQILRDRFGPLDLVIYSLASPRRKDPDSDTVWSSVIKPIGTPHGGKHIDLSSGGGHRARHRACDRGGGRGHHQGDGRRGLGALDPPARRGGSSGRGRPRPAPTPTSAHE